MTESRNTQPDDAAGDDAAAEMKKKFREALDRKNAQHHATVEAAHDNKISHEHGSASQKREFRRKSG